MKTSNLIKIILLPLVTVVIASCEKAFFDKEEISTANENNGTKKSDGKIEVTFRISEFNIVPFEQTKQAESNTNFSRQTRSVVDLFSYCSRLNYVVYKDGKKIDARSQMKGDANFGQVTMKLDAGTYKFLVLAHSSSGNPTLSDPENIKFTNNDMYSDTFSYYGDFTVNEDNTTCEVRLKRNVSCVRFKVNDEFPADVKYMQFEYTGGSGVLNAVTGYGGNVDSRQIKTVDVSTFSTPLTFNLYTFLQTEEATLKLIVQGLASDRKTIVFERTFNDVQMKHCCVTEYVGSLFAKDYKISFTAETDWGEPYYHFDY